MRRLLALLHHICSSQWPVRAGVLLLPAEAVARVRSHGAPLAAPWQTRFSLTTFCAKRSWQLGRGASTCMQGHGSEAAPGHSGVKKPKGT